MFNAQLVPYALIFFKKWKVNLQESGTKIVTCMIYLDTNKDEKFPHFSIPLLFHEFCVHCI